MILIYIHNVLHNVPSSLTSTVHGPPPKTVKGGQQYQRDKVQLVASLKTYVFNAKYLAIAHFFGSKKSDFALECNGTIDV